MFLGVSLLDTARSFIFQEIRMIEGQPVLTDVSIPERGVAKIDPLAEPPAPKSVMTISAHPDDEEFTIAGTLAKWARAGSEITVVCVTSGDAGSNDPAKDAAYKPELALLREAEQRAAGAAIGVKETVFLRHPDGELQATLELRRGSAATRRRGSTATPT
jgi:LmbE family N-acetylglucosaminyl deacetylase